MKEKPKSPTHNVRVYNRKNQDRGTVGHAWVNDDNSVTIRLFPIVTLTNDPDVAITLFPRGELGPAKYPEDRE